LLLRATARCDRCFDYLTGGRLRGTYVAVKGSKGGVLSGRGAGASVADKTMEFGILGPLELIEDGRSIELGGQKQRALLTVLLLDPNRVVSRDHFIDALWEDTPPETAQNALQVHVPPLPKPLRGH